MNVGIKRRSAKISSDERSKLGKLTLALEKYAGAKQDQQQLHEWMTKSWCFACQDFWGLYFAAWPEVHDLLKLLTVR